MNKAWSLFEVLCDDPVFMDGQIERIKVKGQEIVKSTYVYDMNDIKLNEDLYEIWLNGGVIISNE